MGSYSFAKRHEVSHAGLMMSTAKAGVIALAVELGVGQPKRTSFNKAIEGIRKRVQERRLLGHTGHEKE